MFTSDYLNVVGVFCGFNFNKPSAMYLGLSYTEINSDGSGITEPDATSGYKRLLILMNSDNWNIPINGIVTNKNMIQMSEIEVVSGNINFWFLSESIEGNAKIYNKLKAPLLLESNSRVYIPAKNLRFGITNEIST